MSEEAGLVESGFFVDRRDDLLYDLGMEGLTFVKGDDNPAGALHINPVAASCPEKEEPCLKEDLLGFLGSQDGLPSQRRLLRTL